MSEASDKMFEKAMDRRVNGISPSESFGVVMVNDEAMASIVKANEQIQKENVRWQAEQDDMTSKSIGVDTQRWADAKECHDLVIAAFKDKLKNLTNIGRIH